MNLKAIIPTVPRQISRFFTKKILTALNAAIVASIVSAAQPLYCGAASDADLSRLQPGMVLPQMRIQQELDRDQRGYLGLRQGFLGMFAASEFSPADVKADVLVIEFFNIHCRSCQRQAPVLNEVFARVSTHRAMGNRVRFFGIGAGNTQIEADMFGRRYSVGYPLFGDPGFKNYEAIGEPGVTPLTLIVKKTGKDLRIVSAHAGLEKKANFFMAKIRLALESDPDELARVQTLQQPEKERRKRWLDLNMSDQEVRKKVRISMLKAMGEDAVIKDIVIKTYPRSGEIYCATASQYGYAMPLYAQVVSRPPVCDLCHGVHFILVFDAEGQLRFFEPLHLTKYGNVKWSNYDADIMRRMIVGLDIRQPFEYDPSVDTVTMATMTSSLILNSVQKLRDVLNEIKGL